MARRMTVVGCGYLGATHAACMAELGFEVLGLDVDESRVEALQQARPPFYEPGLEPLLRKHVESGRLRFTTSFAEAAEFGDVHFLCVSTPQREGELAADVSYIERAVDSLAPLLRRPCLVVGKSTVPVGTAERLTETLQRMAPVGTDAVLAWNPEFLREGFAVADTLHPDRLVFGVVSPAAEGALRAAFAPVIAQGVPVIVTDYATAELVKTAANSFLATKISFINAMAEVCEAVDADVLTLAQALSHDVRIGGNFLRPGVGFGGGCLPKDIRAFQARADELGVGAALRFLREIDEINNRRRDRVVDLVAAALDGNLAHRRLLVLGAAFKPNSDDVRDSPALAVADLLARTGAEVTVVDPVATHNARRALPHVTYSDSVEAVAAGADGVVLLTEWREFAELDPVRLGPLVRRRVVVDARHALDSDRWRQAGWVYLAPGRPTGTIPSSVPEQRPRVGSADPAGADAVTVTHDPAVAGIETPVGRPS
jgi:UDPglucose 6-dehydrogenase